MTFEETAVRIVKESIRTAYAVDDEIVEPFSPEGDANLSKGLYDSFRRAGCSLQLARFTDYKNWDEEQKQYLKTKDLLVLDWELSKTGVKYESALEILSQALNEPGLPFVCIYTHTKYLDDIVCNILSYVWDRSLNDDNASKANSAFIDDLDESLEDFDEEKLLKIARKSLEIFIAPHRKREINKEVCSEIKKEFGGQSFSNFKQAGEKYFDTENLTEILALFVLTDDQYSKKKNDGVGFPVIPIEQGKTTYSYLINNTFVQLTNKDVVTGGVTQAELYENFAQAVYTRPNNFLSLLGLEHRNFLRDRALTLGKSLNSLDEKAFFYHQECVKEEPNGEEYFDFFLKDMWESQVSGHWQKYKSRILEKTEEYKNNKNISAEINELKNNPSENLIQGLAHLNTHNSILHYEPKPPTLIRFGDIFNICGSDYYLLCITAHCDCLRPSKIDNGFLFVAGQPINLKKSLLKIDENFRSFFVDNNEMSCVQWLHNPLMIYFENMTALDLTRPVQVFHRNLQKILKFVCTQKENYTQRIANNAFRHANRVGINFAGLIQDSEPVYCQPHDKE